MVINDLLKTRKVRGSVMKKVNCGTIDVLQKEIGCSRCYRKTNEGLFIVAVGVAHFYCSIKCMMNLPKNI